MVIVDPVFISCDLCNNSLAAIPTNRHWLNDEQQQLVHRRVILFSCSLTSSSATKVLYAGCWKSWYT